jgi:hypothetical protein
MQLECARQDIFPLGEIRAGLPRVAMRLLRRLCLSSALQGNFHRRQHWLFFVPFLYFYLVGTHERQVNASLFGVNFKDADVNFVADLDNL